MQRAVALLAVLAVVVVAQDDVQAYLGYDITMHAPKGSDQNPGQYFMKFDIPASQLPPHNGTGYSNTVPVIRIRNQFLTNTGGAAMRFWIAKGQRPNLASPARATKIATSALDLVIDYPISSDITGGTYYFVGQSDSCSTCFSTVDVKTAPTLVWVTGGVSVTQPYTIKEDTYTMDYVLSPLAYGTPAMLVLEQQSDVYTSVSFQDDSRDCSVIMTYTQGSLTGRPFDASKAVSTATFIRYPATAAQVQSGDYQTGPITLAAGTWFIAPYGNTIATLGSVMKFDFAVAIGHQPAAAGTVLPSFMVLASLLLASLFAARKL